MPSLVPCALYALLVSHCKMSALHSIKCLCTHIIACIVDSMQTKVCLNVLQKKLNFFGQRACSRIFFACICAMLTSVCMLCAMFEVFCAPCAVFDVFCALCAAEPDTRSLSRATPPPPPP